MKPSWWLVVIAFVLGGTTTTQRTKQAVDDAVAAAIADEREARTETCLRVDVCAAGDRVVEWVTSNGAMCANLCNFCGDLGPGDEQ